MGDKRLVVRLHRQHQDRRVTCVRIYYTHYVIRFLSLKAHSDLASMLTFASAPFASNFDIMSIVILTLKQKMGIEPIIYICILLPLLLLLSKCKHRH